MQNWPGRKNSSAASRGGSGIPYNRVVESRVKFGRRYPWPKWFARLPLTLCRGRDFNGRADTMAQAAYQASGRFGLLLTVSISDDGQRLRLKPGTNGGKRRGSPRCRG